MAMRTTSSGSDIMRFPFKENIMMIVYNSAMSETGPILGMKSGVDSRKA
jgi:hypothetical protein